MEKFYVLPCGRKVTFFGRTFFFGLSFSDALFRTLTVAPSLDPFSKLATKQITVMRSSKKLTHPLVSLLTEL
jgi:hypothetical protein